MKNLQIRRAITVAAIGLVAAVLVTAALLSWTRVFHVGVVLLLAVAVVVLLDIRWRVGASAALQRAALRETRDANSRAGAARVALREVVRKSDSLRERVERAERRVLGSVELANMEARDWRMDIATDDAASGVVAVSSTDAATDDAEGPVPQSQENEVGGSYR